MNDEINLKHLFYFIFNCLVIFQYLSQAKLLGLMDDTTSIKTAIQYSIDPIETTRNGLVIITRMVCSGLFCLTTIYSIFVL